MKNLIFQEIHGAVAGHSSRGMWRSPLMACADARDPLFGHLGEIAHPGHLRPSDLLEGARTVIAFFVPLARDIIISNRKGRWQSAPWALAYIETNRLIDLATARISTFLGTCGFRTATVAATHTFDAQTLLSAWSHRHAACIAGLGTFGLNGMLITEAGCCGRLGSLVTDAEIPADVKPDREFCPWKTDGSCGACVKRCPAGALSVQGLDRHACYRTLLENERRFMHLGRADACGKCLCGLPCSETRP